jgi:hypothetical protein
MMIPELSGILDKLNTDTPKGAAMLRNRLTTRQHADLLTDTLTRMTAASPETCRSRSDIRSHDLIHEWMTRKVAQ